MKIAMFTNTYFPSVGGIERSIHIFAGEMRRLGHSVLVIAPEYLGAQTSTEDVLRVPAIKRINGTPHSVALGLPGELSARVLDFRPDIIHSHQPFLLGDSAVRLARVIAVPIVYTHHTFMERYLHWFPVSWRIVRDISLKLPTAYANLVDHVVTPTGSVAQVIRQRGVTTPISAIPTGIDTEFFGSGHGEQFRARHGLGSSDLVVGHLGRLNEEKNLGYLAEVVVRFIARDPSRRRFLLAGEGNLVGMFEQRFAECGLAHHLVYVGLLQGQDCADAYAAMDAFIFTSLSDTQGLVLSEAMASGSPVFALDATGARDMVHHGDSGWLFPADTTPDAFAAGMENLIVNPEQFAAMGRRAKAAAGAVSVAACTQHMLDLYQQLQETHGHRSGESALTRWDKLMRHWDVEKELLQEKIGCLLANE